MPILKPILIYLIFFFSIFCNCFVCFPNMQIFMGVIDIYNASSLCLTKPNTGFQHFVVPQSQSHRPSCLIQGNGRRVVAMASTVPSSIETVNEVQQSLTGDSFIRPHLRKLSPYQPILPFEVFFSVTL